MACPRKGPTEATGGTAFLWCAVRCSPPMSVGWPTVAQSGPGSQCMAPGTKKAAVPQARGSQTRLCGHPSPMQPPPPALWCFPPQMHLQTRFLVPGPPILPRFRLSWATWAHPEMGPNRVRNRRETILSTLALDHLGCPAMCLLACPALPDPSNRATWGPHKEVRGWVETALSERDRGTRGVPGKVFGAPFDSVLGRF